MKQVVFASTAVALYGFGDASGSAFGATLQVGNKIMYHFGQWSEQVADESSSNWRELNNLVEAVALWCSEKSVGGAELFLFTDNTTAENAFCKGTSKSKKLSELVLRMKLLEMQESLKLHVIHVSGKRMIAQGTDGISRGDFTQGVMKGDSMLRYVPLHLNALERQPNGMEAFLKSIMKGLEWTCLSPSEWFTTGHKNGNFVWCPAPAAADVVVEQLGKARHKRSRGLHLVVVPRLFTGRWRRHMIRRTDFYMKLDECNVWPKSMHEPLLIFVALPYISWDPLFKSQEELLERPRRHLLEAGVWTTHPERSRDILRQLLLKARTLCPL
jgi:hypothetical protein